MIEVLVANLAEPILIATGQFGPEGPQSAVAGAQGFQGTQGTQGVQGFQGNQGQGTQGNQGVQGVQGFGVQGDQGSQGIQGYLGVDGAQGVQGFGVQGDQGISGTQGSQGGGGAEALSDLTDVNTTTPPPNLNDSLKWNGAEWVPAPYDYSFTFVIASFSDGQSTPQLIGSGTWKATAAINFTAAYTNGPPTAAYISCASWAGNLTLVTPYTSGSSAQDTAYPGTKDTSISFTLHATKGSTLASVASVTFNNNIYWGASTKTTGYTSADITGLAGSAISTNQNRSVSVSA